MCCLGTDEDIVRMEMESIVTNPEYYYATVNSSTVNKVATEISSLACVTSK